MVKYMCRYPPESKVCVGQKEWVARGLLHMAMGNTKLQCFLLLTGLLTGLYSIVGKGKHSKDKIQKLKPAVVKLCRKLKLQVLKQKNPGRVHISLTPPPPPPPPQPTITPQTLVQQPLRTSKKSSHHVPSRRHRTLNAVTLAPSPVIPEQQSPSTTTIHEDRHTPAPGPQAGVQPQGGHSPTPPPQVDEYWLDLENGGAGVAQDPSLPWFLWRIFGGVSRWARSMVNSIF